MSQKIYLQLVGADSYGSPLVGSVLRGQSIEITDIALAQKLIKKGGLNEDGSHKPLFRQVTQQEAYSAPALENEGGDLRLPDLNPSLFAPAESVKAEEPAPSATQSAAPVQEEEESEEEEEEEEPAAGDQQAQAPASAASTPKPGTRRR